MNHRIESKLFPFLLSLFLIFQKTTAGPQGTQSASIYRFTLGFINATIIFDGPTIFAQNPFLVPDEEVQQSYFTCLRETNPILASQNVILLDTPTARVIVDPGARGVQNVPFFARSGLLFEGLADAGIAPESIDAVLITHGHADHVSGLSKLDGTAAFPNAKVFISERDHKFWTSNPLPVPPDAPLPDTLNVFAQAYRASIAPYTSRLHLQRRGRIPLPGFRFLPTPGHSPGHSSIEVNSAGHRLIIAGDAWISKPDQVQNPDWTVGTDSTPMMASQSRRRLLNLVAHRRNLVMAFHEQFPGLGYVSKNGMHFDWIPAPLRLPSELK